MDRTDRSRTYPAGAWICREGEHGGSAFLVTRRGGAERILAQLGPGDVFGEVTLIDAGPRSADAIALEDTDLIEIRSESLATTLGEADPLVPLILRVLAERFREAQGRVGAPGGEAPRALAQGSAFEALRRCALERVRHEDALRGALAAGELELHYQPIVSLASGMLAGFEALVRWRSPTLGLVSPADFVQLAERTGLIGELGAFVLSEAMRTHASWLGDFRKAFPHEPLPYMGVNVSPAQLRTDAARGLLVEALRAGSLDPRLVRLELTESLLVADPGLAKELLTGLRRLGVSLAIDDFGTGYSSLRALCDFPFDVLKIDKSFVDGVPHDDDSVRVIRSVAALARELSMTVVAEGVESDAQAERLAELGCGYGQGYRFAKPAPRAETLELLRSATTW